MDQDETVFGDYTFLKAQDNKLPGFYEVHKVIRNTDRLELTGYHTNRRNLEYLPQCSNMRNQVEILGSISHPNIQEYVDTLISGDDLFFLTEREHESYFSIYGGGITIQEDKLSFYFKQLMSAVSYLHENGIIHRDIRPESIFIDKNGNLKLMNFFNAVRYDPDKKAVKGEYGTLNYQAQEIFTGCPYDPEKAEVWACGVLLLSSLTYQNVFRSDKECDIQKQILTKELKYPQSCSPALVKLLNRMLVMDPEMRANCAEVLNSEWLKNAPAALHSSGL